MRNRSVLSSSSRAVPSGRTLATLALALTLGLGARGASAQVALEEEEEEEAVPPPPVEPMLEAPRIGVGLRLRNVRIPRSLLEAFVERAPAGSSNFGIGLDVVRRKGDFEFQFGLEYEKISITPGVWIDKGDMIPQDEPDYVEFDGFGWFTIEATFLYHTPITKQFAIRYGGGAGIGIILGDIVRTDYICTSSSVEDCDEKPGAENVKTPYDNVPPVMLVVNAIVGVQIRPIDNLYINIEGGIRTMPFFGTSVGAYF
jgi:hypothetical protein